MIYYFFLDTTLLLQTKLLLQTNARRMNYYQSRFDPPAMPLLLKTGRMPLLLTTSIISANYADAASPELSGASQTLLPAAPLIRLLGKVKGRMPSSVLAVEQVPPPPRTCRRCNTTVGLRRRERCCPHCRLLVRYKTLLREQKLAAAVWEQIRRVLCLPSEIENLPRGQCRSVCHLLNNLVRCFSFDEQIALTEAHIVEALSSRLDLPPGLVKLIHKPAEVKAGELSSASVFDVPNGNGQTSGGTRNKRQPITAQQFTEVAARQGAYCYWCGIKVVREAQIPLANRVSKNGNTIVYLVGDELREEAFGTIDHLVRVIDGGNNHPANLVISCYQCNQEREKRTLQHNRPFARRRLPCPVCGGRFFHPDWGCCSICGATSERPKKSLSLFRYIIECLGEIMKKWHQK